MHDTQKKMATMIRDGLGKPSAVESFCFIGLNVDFTGVVSTVGGGGVLRGKKTKNKTKTKQQQNASGCGGG